MNAAILVAGGSGSRMAVSVPKQFLPLAGKELFRHSLDTFLAALNGRFFLFDKVLLILPESEIPSFSRQFDHYAQDIDTQRLILVSGGHTRAQSVYNGVSRLQQIFASQEKTAKSNHLQSNDFGLKDCIVFVHDAARPLISTQDLAEIFFAMQKKSRHSLLLCGRWAADTILMQEKSDEVLTKILDRKKIFYAETPQVFYLTAYEQAIQSCETHVWESFTDESSLFLYTQKTVWPYPLKNINMKITFPQDLLVAEFLLQNSSLNRG